MSNLVFTEATEVRLTLYNDVHVQQAMSLVYQHPELSEVLKLQMQGTEGQEPVGEPQQLDPVMQAAIKPVDRREGSIPVPIPSEREYSSHASLALGLNSQEAYSRLSRYLQSVAQLDLIPVEANGNCSQAFSVQWTVHWSIRPSEVTTHHDDGQPSHIFVPNTQGQYRYHIWVS